MGSKPNECMCMYNLPIKKEDYLSKKDEKKKAWLALAGPDI